MSTRTSFDFREGKGCIDGREKTEKIITFRDSK